MASLLETCKKSADLVERYLDSPNESEVRQAGKKQVLLSIDIIERALDSISIQNIALSFNGGKDCQVMLILFQAVLYMKCRDSSYFSSNDTIPAVYVRSSKAFEEVDSFVESCNQAYALSTVQLPYPMKDAFSSYLDSNPEIKAILVGIRRTDPYGETLTYQQATDHGWPYFIRVHPIIEWHFVEVWDFLRYLKVPYCKLYDLGYTSLGGSDDTKRNPSLLKEVDENGVEIYNPAYLLIDDGKERLGRSK